MTDFTIVHPDIDRRRHWTSRDFVSLFLAIAMMILAGLAWQMWHTQQNQRDDLAALTRQLQARDARIALKDARIRQLTDALIAAKIPVPPFPTPAPGPSATPEPTPSPSPSSWKTHDPTPRPSRRPTRTPTGNPPPRTCLLTPRPCVTPPPFRLLLLRLALYTRGN